MKSNFCAGRAILDNPEVVRELANVDDPRRQQVQRIINHCSTTSRAVLAIDLNRVRSEFSLAGRLGSGAFMVTLVGEIGRQSDQLLSELVLKIAPVSRCSDAFEEIEAALRRWLRACEADLPELCGQSHSLRLQDRSVALDLGRATFAKVCDSIEERLQIEKFDFQAGQLIESDQPSLGKRGKGGRPPADFWDDMWSAVAVQLYDGSLNPKTQAQIERAMMEWIEANGFTAAESTVRARARRLWDRLCSSED